MGMSALRTGVPLASRNLASRIRLPDRVQGCGLVTCIWNAVRLMGTMSERIRFPRRMRRLKTLPVLPTLLTAGNLASGTTALLCAADGQVVLGAWLIFVAMLCDLFDGKVARMTGTDGEFGVQLDSLADVISFGVAPALLMHRTVLDRPGVWGEGERWVWAIAIWYAVLTAIRLARYNVESQSVATKTFRGLPSPGAAAALCSWIIVISGLRQDLVQGTTDWMAVETFRSLSGVALMVITFALGAMMVSTIRFPHLGNTVLGGHLGFRRLVLLMAAVGLLIAKPVWGLTAATSGYILYGAIPGTIGAIRGWIAGKPILDEDDDEDDDDIVEPVDPARAEGHQEDSQRTSALPPGARSER
jgi:CDP-diacylglycerol--serine O-phosphatidyltransferase